MVQGKKILVASLFAAASFITLRGTAQALPVYGESGDAGQTLATAANTAGTAGTTLTSITGTIGTAVDADLYVFTIANVTTFAATVTSTAGIDTALFLFNASGVAVFTNDDQSGTSLNPRLPAGNSLLTSLSPGTYYLGISLSGNEPVNSAGQLLFNGYPGGDTTAVRGAASGLNPATLSNFNGNPFFAETGAYTVTFAVPEPSTWAALVLGSAATGATVLRRRSGKAL